jgi:glucose/arabinose dehydrogenase
MLRSTRRFILLAAPLLGLTAAILVLVALGATTRAEGGSAAMAASIPVVDLVPFATVDFTPTDIANSGVAGDDRLFVVERHGKIRIVTAAGTVKATPYLSITERVIGNPGYLGLLGLAFDPDYDNNGYFYVNYTHQATAGDLFSRISRFTVTADPDVADPDSELIILSVEQPPLPGGSENNGGDLAFGPDGFLYFGLGDGGGIGDPDAQAQDPLSLLGKMIRLDVSGVTSTTNYLIPSDNPFVGDPGTLDEIWALGLRNPWRFSFDSQTGDILLSDVGEATWEEINLQPAPSSGGENYGWRCYEGNEPFNLTGCGPINQFTFPIYVYDHNTPGCAVTGGFVYRGSLYPGLQGHYFFADHCFGWLRSLDMNQGGQEAIDQQFNEVLIVSFGEDINGELYAADMLNNRIYRLVGKAPIFLPAVFVP